MLQEYYSALASMVLTVGRDKPELRQNIYEVARSRLREQLDGRAQELSPAVRARRLQELEAAIEQLEADLAKSGAERAYDGGLLYSPNWRVEITPPTPADQQVASNSAAGAKLGRERRPRTMLAARSILLFVVAAVLGFTAYAAVKRALHQVDKIKQADESISRDFSNPKAANDFPLPTAYGVYALTDSQLIALAPLPIKIPDHSNTTSGLITSTSRTELPNGNIHFVVFNRDLMRQIPEKIVVRIVARIIPNASEVGKLRSTSDEASTSWTIRNVSFDMRVAPVKANPAMIAIGPADADFVFPPGRYALMLKDVPYDFAVDGLITDLRQCLERNEVLNVTTYTQCQHP
jgi:hypothetical protein